MIAAPNLAPARHLRRSRSGFTLIEMLIVMTIIAVLAGLGVVALPALMRRGPKLAAQTFLTNLSAALEGYKNSGEGTYPPTTLKDYVGVGNLTNLENCGIESVVLCMNSKNYSGSFGFEDSSGCKLENLDGDQTQVQLTKFGTRDLWEVLDPWGNPYVYFNAADYSAAAEVGVVSGKNGPVKVVPWKNSKTKSFCCKDTFQLISAGPDGEYNTEDDITPFERN